MTVLIPRLAQPSSCRGDGWLVRTRSGPSQWAFENASRRKAWSFQKKSRSAAATGRRAQIETRHPSDIEWATADVITDASLPARLNDLTWGQSIRPRADDFPRPDRSPRGRRLASPDRPDLARLPVPPQGRVDPVAGLRGDRRHQQRDDPAAASARHRRHVSGQTRDSRGAVRHRAAECPARDPGRHRRRRPDLDRWRRWARRRWSTGSATASSATSRCGCSAP